jgi:hypothetical protein
MKTFVTASAPEATDEDLARLSNQIDGLNRSLSAALGPALQAELTKALAPLIGAVTNTRRSAAPAPAFGFKLPEAD